MKYIILPALLCLVCCKPTDFAGKLAAGANYTRYIATLEKSGMANTAMGKEWLTIGKEALENTKEIEFPYREEGYFTS
ncbi:MAG: hypothetical protein AAFO82_03040, partial [Bacteroidota bacterium]